MQTLRHFALILVALMLAACGSDTADDGPVEDDIRKATNNTVINDVPGNSAPANNTNGETSADMGSPDLRDIVVDSCEPGMLAGCASDSQILVCNDEGNAYEPVACPQGERCLVDECTTNVCVPGTQTCEGGEQFKICNEDGTGYEAPQACPGDTVCNEGSCRSICELGKYRSSYIGCEYWTLDLDQHPDPTQNPKPDSIPHSVVISNPNDRDATIAFYSQVAGASVTVSDPIVPAKSSKAFTMPRLDISGTSKTRNAINIVSSDPVSAHQFNPLNDERVYSNDASLLLPVNVVGKEYYVVNWPTQILPAFMNFDPPDQHSYVTILAVSPGTTNLNVTTTAQIEYGQGVGAVGPGTPRGFSLTRGDVLNLQAKDASSLVGAANDLTGSYIIADQPIAVFAGHESAVIGEPGGGNSGGPTDDRMTSGTGNCCADHIEQQLFPVNALGTTYIAAFSPSRGTKVDHWRIVAAEAVTVNTNPPQEGANGVSLQPGEHIEIWSDESFEVNATGKVLVAQFLVSQQRTSQVIGDPAMVLAVPSERFRSDYNVLTPDGYDEDWITIIRPVGAEVRLNGTAISTTWSTVGSTYEIGYVAVTPGVQSLESDEKFGIIAYGFDNAVSYAYPGGLDLVGVEAD